MKVRHEILNGKAVIAFLACGYPNLETTEEVAYALDGAGVDLIVLGIPFSDPTGEGSALRKASECALKMAITTEHIFDLVQRVRQSTSIALAFRTYANVVFSYGTVPFLKRAAHLGVNALILNDVPYEEKEEFASVCREVGVDYISLVTPTSKDRLENIAREAQGFIYLTSPSVEDGSIETIRRFTSLPMVAECGAGESQPEQLAQRAAKADGIIIESTIMEMMADYGDNAPEFVGAYAKSVFEAVKGHSHLKKRVESPTHTRVIPTRTASSNP